MFRSLGSLFVTLIATAGVGAASEVAALPSASLFLPADALAPGPITAKAHPEAELINRFLADHSAVAGFRRSDLGRKDYLTVIAGEVVALQTCLNEEGRVIDPVRKVEWQYATPCYAHAVAVLAAARHAAGTRCLESGMKALDLATLDMAHGNEVIPQRHGDFYTVPVMAAFRLFKPFAQPERYEAWRDRLAHLEPARLYAVRQGDAGNWNLVNVSGEFLRHQAGFTGLDYIESCLLKQQAAFTPLGMFCERGQPLAYDQFARHFLALMLREGYRGSSFEFYRTALWRAAWVSAFMQSPSGEAPTGYRSSHHLWNEAESAVTFEIFATQYALAQRPVEAGAFKRAAHLSLGCLQRWLRADGSGYVVKNRYPVASQHGYEDYSSHTQYNLLACSMLALAWENADDSIVEQPAPADRGGFVLPILEPFHKVFANFGGVYVEYDTSGDHIYNPTGLLRVHLRGSLPQLGPSDGCAPKFSGKGMEFAVGPAWKPPGEVPWHSLASATPNGSSVNLLPRSGSKGGFRVHFTLTSESDAIGPTVIDETVALDSRGVTITDTLTGPADAMSVYYPMLVFDGEEESQVTLDRRELTLRLRSKGVRVTILEPAQSTWQRTGLSLGHRSGLVEPAYFEIRGNTAKYRIEARR